MIFTQAFSYKELINSKKEEYPLVLHTQNTQKHLQTLREKPSDYRGFYINLLKDRDRNRDMIQHLKDLNFQNYSRIDAVDGKVIAKKYDTKLDSGSLGCGFSHKSVLEKNLGSDSHLHILEDDALLYEHLPKIFNLIESKVEWDIIYTDVYFSMLSPTVFYNLHEKYKLYKTKGDISIVDLQGIDFSAATSYFVNKKSIKKFNELLSSDWYKNSKHDTFINTLVQKGLLKAFVIVPFVSTISKHSENSTIDESYNDNMFALDILRKSLYIDAKQKELSSELKKSTEDLETSDMLDIYTNSMKTILHNLDKKLHVRVVK